MIYVSYIVSIVTHHDVYDKDDSVMDEFGKAYHAVRVALLVCLSFLIEK